MKRRQPIAYANANSPVGAVEVRTAEEIFDENKALKAEVGRLRKLTEDAVNQHPICETHVGKKWEELTRKVPCVPCLIKEVEQLRDFLQSALPKIQCDSQEDSNLIMAIGEHLEAAKQGYTLTKGEK